MMKCDKVYRKLILEQQNYLHSVQTSLICEDIDWWGVAKNVLSLPVDLVVKTVKTVADTATNVIKPEVKQSVQAVAQDDDKFKKFIEYIKKEKPAIYKALADAKAIDDPMKAMSIIAAISTSQAVAKKNEQLAKAQADLAAKDKALKALQAEKDARDKADKAMTDEDWQPSDDRQINELYEAVKAIMVKAGKKPEDVAKRWVKQDKAGKIFTVFKGKLKLIPKAKFEADRDKWLARAKVVDESEEEIIDELKEFYEDDTAKKAIMKLTNWNEDKYDTRTEKFADKGDLILATKDKHIKRINIVKKKDKAIELNSEFFFDDGRFDASHAAEAIAKIAGVDETTEKDAAASKEKVEKFKQACLSFQRGLEAAKIAKSCDNYGGDDVFVIGGATLYAWNGKQLGSYSDEEIDSDEEIQEFRAFLNKDYENGNPCHPRSMIHVLEKLKNCKYAHRDTKTLCQTAINEAQHVMKDFPEFDLNDNDEFENAEIKKLLN